LGAGQTQQSSGQVVNANGTVATAATNTRNVAAGQTVNNMTVGNNFTVNNNGTINNLQASGSNVVINNSGHIGNLNVSIGSSANINNSGTIGTVNIGTVSTVTVNNNNVINTINANAGSVVTVNNDFVISAINARAGSTVAVNNNSYSRVSAVNIGVSGSKATVNINNCNGGHIHRVTIGSDMNSFANIALRNLDWWNNLSVITHGAFIDIRTGSNSTNRLHFQNDELHYSSFSDVGHERRFLARCILELHHLGRLQLATTTNANWGTAFDHIIATAAGRVISSRLGDVEIDIRVLRAIFEIHQEFGYIGVSSLAGGRHGANSAHYYGRAVDLNMFNNRAVRDTSDARVREINDILKSLGLGQSQFYYRFADPDGNHGNHFHLGWYAR
jgi:hypothetical protein